MANEEHLVILRQGVEVWNAWREANPKVILDFKGANLHGMSFVGVDLSLALFIDADLAGCNFTNAELFGTIFNRADLTHTNFEKASLSLSEFREANLIGANFRDAHLPMAILTRANLSEANFTWASLSNAKLWGATLRNTALPWATLYDANLTRVDACGADLSKTNLRGANLEGVNLSQVDLTEATLIRTTLNEADLTHVIVSGTTFDNLDLSKVHGLETVHHKGPSTIGIDTLYRSQGQIPEIFLRGCGVPDSMIAYARSLVAAQRPTDYHSVFISYSSYDEAIAQCLHADLQSQGVRCWFAPHDLEIGTPIAGGIDEAIGIFDKLLIVLSESSVKSNWVAFEVSTALHREVKQGRTMLFPIRLDDTVLHTPSGWAAQLRTRNIGDFRGWKDHDRYQEAFARLLRNLKAKDQAGT